MALLALLVVIVLVSGEFCGLMIVNLLSIDG